MDKHQMETLDNAINMMAERAGVKKEYLKADDALKYSQAVLNLANAKATLDNG